MFLPLRFLFLSQIQAVLLALHPRTWDLLLEVSRCIGVQQYEWQD